MPLTLQQLKSLDTLVQQGLDRDPMDRRAWFDSLAIESESMRELVERALFPESAVSTNTFLDRAPRVNVNEQSDAPDLLSGDRVGSYTLISPLDEGGSASVWRAERSDGVLKREVALKLPFFIGNSRGWRDRALRERDILASLNHPNIATIYDAGIEANGRPWLALELIDGLPIDRYCNEHLLDADQRITLLVRVARAVEYAHARGVIHRDLKPANILIDRTGQPKLLDFGIAKLLDSNENAASAHPTMLTRLHGRPFTPEYASPEQQRGESITTAVDVYALGVVLHELIAGTRPTTDQSIAREHTSPRIDLRAANKQNQSKAPSLAFRNDLNAIVQKALHPDPAKRYSTVNAFADDLERYLRHEAVMAQPDSSWYRFTRFVRRNRVAASGVAAVFLSLSAGLATTMWQANEADSQRNLAILESSRAERAAGVAVAESERSKSSAARAEQEFQRAEQEALDARVAAQRADLAYRRAENARGELSVANALITAERDRANLSEQTALASAKRNETVKKYLLSLFATASHARDGKNTHKVEDVISRAGQQIIDVIHDRTRDPSKASRLPPDVETAIRSDIATREELVSTVAKLHGEYGLDRDSLVLWQFLLRERIARNAAAGEIVEIEGRIGLAHAFLDQHALAEQSFATAKARFSAHTISDTSAEGILLARRGHARLKAARFEDSLADSLAAISTLNAKPDATEDLLLAKHTRAAARAFLGESRAQIRQDYRDLISTMEKTRGTYHPDTILSKVWLTSWLIHWSEFGEANKLAEQTWSTVLDAQGDATMLSTFVANQVGQLRTVDGDPSGGRALLERTVAIQDQYVGNYPERDFYNTRTNLLQAYSLAGMTEKACDLARKTMRLTNEPSIEDMVRKQLYAVYATAGMSLLDCGSYAEAYSLLARSAEALERAAPVTESVLYQSRARLAAAAAFSGEKKKADKLVAKVFDRYATPNLTDAYPRFQAEFVAVQRLIERNDRAAIASAKRIQSIVNQNPPQQKAFATHLQSLALRALAQALLAFNENQEAQRVSLELVELMSKLHVSDSPKLAHDHALAAIALARNGEAGRATHHAIEASRVFNDSKRAIAPHLRKPFDQLRSEFTELATRG
jgi:hypothetical protein